MALLIRNITLDQSQIEIKYIVSVFMSYNTSIILGFNEHTSILFTYSNTKLKYFS